MTRQRTVPNPDALAAAVDDYRRDGYAVQARSDQRAVVRQRDHGGLVAHLLLAVLTAWWTLGLGNLAYALWRRWVSVDRVEVVVDG